MATHPVFLPGESQGWRSLVGCHLWGRMHALEEEMATYSSILAWKNPIDRGTWWATIHVVVKSRTRLSDFCVCVCVYPQAETVAQPLEKPHSGSESCQDQLILQEFEQPKRVRSVH